MYCELNNEVFWTYVQN